MSRSSWKPRFIHPQVIESFSAPEIFVQNRATTITENRVGLRFQIYNGIRWFPLEVTPERVGQRVGEFAPTRKRPNLKKKKK